MSHNDYRITLASRAISVMSQKKNELFTITFSSPNEKVLPSYLAQYEVHDLASCKISEETFELTDCFNDFVNLMFQRLSRYSVIVSCDVCVGNSSAA